MIPSHPSQARTSNFCQILALLENAYPNFVEWVFRELGALTGIMSLRGDGALAEADMLAVLNFIDRQIGLGKQTHKPDAPLILTNLQRIDAAEGFLVKVAGQAMKHGRRYSADFLSRLEEVDLRLQKERHYGIPEGLRAFKALPQEGRLPNEALAHLVLEQVALNVYICAS